MNFVGRLCAATVVMLSYTLRCILIKHLSKNTHVKMTGMVPHIPDLVTKRG